MNYNKISLSKNYANLKRLNKIISVFTKHGFADIVEKLNINEYISNIDKNYSQFDFKE